MNYFMRSWRRRPKRSNQVPDMWGKAGFLYNGCNGAWNRTSHHIYSVLRSIGACTATFWLKPRPVKRHFREGCGSGESICCREAKKRSALSRRPMSSQLQHTVNMKVAKAIGHRSYLNPRLRWIDLFSWKSGDCDALCGARSVFSDLAYLG